MLVTKENIAGVLAGLGSVLSLDTETTGFHSHKSDKLFSIIVSEEKTDYYFNFQNYEGTEGLPRILMGDLAHEFASKERVWFMQNAKFDLGFLAKEGVTLRGHIIDLMVMDRIHFNQHLSYKLVDIAKRWGGTEKLDIVAKYVEEHKLKSPVVCPHTERETEQHHYERVPLELMQRYGEADGRTTLETGRKILKALGERDMESPSFPKQKLVMDAEIRLTRSLFDMERLGVQLDVPYCKEGLSFYRARCEQQAAIFKSLTGLDYKKGTTVFEEVFKDEQTKWKKTEKGNWRWDSDILEAFKHPAARVAMDHAEAKKQGDYFENFLFHMDSGGVLHTNFRQSGTLTGRLSSSDVNLQNLTNPDKYDKDSASNMYPVRRAFVPREGFFFVMIDYEQSEFRLLLDYAKPQNIIDKVLAGLDVHEATAQVAKVTRKEAKTVNFLTAYGGGVAKLVANLYKPMGSRDQVGALFKHINGWRFREGEEAAFKTLTPEMIAHDTPLIEQAYGIQQNIFGMAPEIKQTLKRIQEQAEDRGFVFTWFGRRMYFPDKRWCYKAPNHVIQGGGADMMKIALNRVHEYLADKRSRMVLTIHDELALEISHDEMDVPEQVRLIMGDIYPHKLLPQVASISWNKESLATKDAWNEAERNEAKGTNT